MFGYESLLIVKNTLSLEVTVRAETQQLTKDDNGNTSHTKSSVTYKDEKHVKITLW